MPKRSAKAQTATQRRLDALSDSDWETKTSAGLGRELNISPQTVRAYRISQGKSKGPGAGRGASPKRVAEVQRLLKDVPLEHWEKVKFTDIAKATGLPIPTVSRYARAQGKGNSAKRTKELEAITDAQWSTLTTEDLAEQTGLKWINIYFYRRRHNKPKVPARLNLGLECLTETQWKWLSQADLAAACGSSDQYISIYRNSNNKPKRLPKSKRDPQREAEIRWALFNPEKKTATRLNWEQSPKGKAWLKANQAAKNARRKAWREKRKQQQLPYT